MLVQATNIFWVYCGSDHAAIRHSSPRCWRSGCGVRAQPLLQFCVDAGLPPRPGGLKAANYIGIHAHVSVGRFDGGNGAATALADGGGIPEGRDGLGIVRVMRSWASRRWGHPAASRCNASSRCQTKWGCRRWAYSFLFRGAAKWPALRRLAQHIHQHQNDASQFDQRHSTGPPDAVAAVWVAIEIGVSKLATADALSCVPLPRCGRLNRQPLTQNGSGQQRLWLRT